MADEPTGAEAIRLGLLELAAQLIQESDKLRQMAQSAIVEARRLRAEPPKSRLEQPANVGLRGTGRIQAPPAA